MKKRIFYEEFNSFYYYHGSTANWEMQGFHFHKEYEVLLFMSEGASVSFENRVYQAGVGDLILISNREYHKTAGAYPGQYERYVLMFEPELITYAEKAFGYPFAKYFENRSVDFNHMVKLSGERLKTVIRLFHKIEMAYHNKNGDEDRVSLQLAVLEMMVELNRIYDFFERETVTAQSHGLEAISGETNQESIRCDRERVEQIKKYITGHVDEKLDLEELAGRFYMNRHYMSHYFKRETGFTLGQYITTQKITRAKELLKQGFSVTETAIALSYNSDSHFINTFKKMTGTTPKKYAGETEP